MLLSLCTWPYFNRKWNCYLKKRKASISLWQDKTEQKPKTTDSNHGSGRTHWFWGRPCYLSVVTPTFTLDTHQLLHQCSFPEFCLHLNPTHSLQVPPSSSFCNSCYWPVPGLQHRQHVHNASCIFSRTRNSHSQVSFYTLRYQLTELWTSELIWSCLVTISSFTRGWYICRNSP